MRKTFLLLCLLAFIGLVFGASIIQIRRDTAANWTAADPVLAQGEIGLELVTGKIKFGDGVTAWSALPYFTVAGFLTWADANAAFVPYVGADYDLNIGIYSIKARADSNFVNIGFTGFIFGDGSKLTNLPTGTDTDTIRTYTGIAPISVANDTNVIRLVTDFNQWYWAKTDLNGSFYGKIDINSNFVPYIGADYALNMGSFGITSTGDSNYTNIGIGGNAFIKNALISMDLNVTRTARISLDLNVTKNMGVDGNFYVGGGTGARMDYNGTSLNIGW